MADDEKGSPPSKNATRGDSWVQRHKTALIGGGIAIAAIIVFIVFKNRNSSSVNGYPTGYTSSLANVNPFLNTSGDLSSLVGPAGPAGATGPAGPRGPKGPRGQRGKPPPRHHKPKESGVIPVEHLANAPR